MAQQNPKALESQNLLQQRVKLSDQIFQYNPLSQAITPPDTSKNSTEYSMSPQHANDLGEYPQLIAQKIEDSLEFTPKKIYQNDQKQQMMNSATKRKLQSSSASKRQELLKKLAEINRHCATSNKQRVYCNMCQRHICRAQVGSVYLIFARVVYQKLKNDIQTPANKTTRPSSSASGEEVSNQLTQTSEIIYTDYSQIEKSNQDNTAWMRMSII